MGPPTAGYGCMRGQVLKGKSEWIMFLRKVLLRRISHLMMDGSTL
jgi:hypothetical protein